MQDVLKGKRVLVVDDELDVCRFIEFELPECEVDIAVSAGEAREHFGRARYDLVIVDVMGVDGFELLKEFSDRTPCIVITARALNEKHLAKAMEGRAVLYLPKEEIGRLDEYAAKAIASKEPLWNWLFRRIDFRRWFGPTFKPPGEAARPTEA